MQSQTSLVASQVRLHQWADQIRDCGSRPKGMSVGEWCQTHGITKANYYYRLRKVREACLAVTDIPSFVEVPDVSEQICTCPKEASEPAGFIQLSNGVRIALFDHASSEFMRNLIGAVSDA